MEDDRATSESAGAGSAGPEPTRSAAEGGSDASGAEGPGRSGGAGEAAGSAPGGGEGRDSGDEGSGRRAGRRDRAERTWGETLHGVQEAVGDMVGEVLDGVRDVAVGRRFPRMDVVRVEDEGYRVFVDLPGVEKDDLEVTTLGGELTVAGRRPPREVPEGADVLRSERGHGSFRRSVRLPADAHEEEVRATLEGGVLVVRVPLADPGDAQRVEID